MVEPEERLPELDAELADLVAAYRVETGRDAAQVEAALQHVTATVGAPAAAAVGLSGSAKVALGGALLAVVGALVVTAMRDPVEPPTMSREAEPRPVVVVEKKAIEARPVPEVEAVVPEPIVETKEGVRASRPRARRPAPVTPRAELSLQAELALLQRARSAIRDGRPADAETILRRHRREHPRSTLAEERDATEIEALCAMGDRARAEAKASAFRRQFPSSTRTIGCP